MLVPAYAATINGSTGSSQSGCCSPSTVCGRWGRSRPPVRPRSGSPMISVPMRPDRYRQPVTRRGSRDVQGHRMAGI